MNDVLGDAIDEVKKILADKNNKTAAVGATLAYLMSKSNKERNAALGGLAGYLLSDGKPSTSGTTESAATDGK